MIQSINMGFGCQCIEIDLDQPHIIYHEIITY